MTPASRSLASLRAAGFALSAAILAWSASAAAAPKVVGITAAVINDVKVRPAGGRNFLKARVRQRVKLADRVRTGSRSRMQIVLLDKTRFSVGSNAQLTINRFVYDPDGGSVSAAVAKGAFRFMSGRSRRATKSVTTPAATIGIRGTVFDGAVGEIAVNMARRETAIPRDTQHDPMTATFAVLRGPGPNTQGNVAVGRIEISGVGEAATQAPVVLDRPLLAAYVPYAGAPPIGPFPISLSNLARLGDFIVPPVDREFAPFDASTLPFPPDRPRGPPPIIGRPRADYADYNDSGPRNGGGFPGSDIPGASSLPGLHSGHGILRDSGRDHPPESNDSDDYPNEQEREPVQPGSSSETEYERPSTPAPVNDPAARRTPLGTQPTHEPAPVEEQPIEREPPQRDMYSERGEMYPAHDAYPQ